MASGFEIKASLDEMRDLNRLRYLSADVAARVKMQSKLRKLYIPDSDFFDIQKAVANHVIRLENYYKYSGPSSLPDDLDKNWAKFLLLWNKRVVFTENQCVKFAPKIAAANEIIQNINSLNTIHQSFTELSQLFLRAVDMKRQIIYA